MTDGKKLLVYAFAAFMIIAITGIYAEGNGPKTYDIVTINEDLSFSLGSSFPLLIAMGFFAWQALFAKKTSWPVMIVSCLTILIYLAGTGVGS